MQVQIQRISFKNNDIFYDIYEDWAVIDNDFKRDHNCSLQEALETTNWESFSLMLSTLDPNRSMFYHIINIRSEKDNVKISKFTPQERKIYLGWKKRHPVKKIEKSKEQIEQECNDFLSMFGYKKKDK